MYQFRIVEVVANRKISLKAHFLSFRERAINLPFVKTLVSRDTQIVLVLNYEID